MKSDEIGEWSEKLVLERWEAYMMSEFVKYSTPYMMGWHGMYDHTFAIRNKADDQQDEFP
jgi:hypothetical protein